MNQGYLLIPEIEVSDCNLESSHLTVSFPLTATAGFVEAMFLELKNQLDEELGYGTGDQIDYDAFAVYLHQYQMYRGITKNPLALCKGSGGKPNDNKILDPPITPEIKGRVCFSLIIRVSYDDSHHISPVQEGLADILPIMRFAGGDIFSWGGRSYTLNKRNDLSGNSILCPFFDTFKETVSALKRLPYGWFIKDRGDILHEAEGDKLQTMLDAVAFFPEKEEGYTRKHSGWLYATCTGYQLIEEPGERNGRRFDEYPHAYCEPVHSLAELVHGRQLLNAAKNSSSDDDGLNKQTLFWRWRYRQDIRLIQLTALQV